jgi:hypothetical protein
VDQGLTLDASGELSGLGNVDVLITLTATAVPRRSSVQGSIEVYEIRVDPVLQVSPAHLPGVQECLVVTSGGVSCGPADDPADLRAGDSIRFAASVPHVYQGADAQSRARLVVIHQ